MISKLRWWYYWHITRRRQKFIPWIARKLPKRIEYYVVIDGMAYHTVVVNPHIRPDDVKGWDVLRAFEKVKS